VRYAARADGKLSVGNEANNGTGGQRHAFFVGKPCSLNAIEGVTGKHSAFESRTKEQGEWPSGRTTWHVKARPVKLSRIQRIQSRALPGVEGLLE
jgi:hypothetical protein